MATHLPVLGGHAEGFAATARTDAWWRRPLVTFIALAAVIAYAVWAALQGELYVSPSVPAIYIVVVAGAFRFTCYAHRNAFYRAFAGSPPACSVGSLATRKYRGETALLVVQNIHRYALYAALLLLVVVGKDAVDAFGRDDLIGAVLQAIDLALLAAYTLGCHSLRHLVGGRKDCMSSCGKSTPALGAWRLVGWFNVRHAALAWVSLGWVIGTDLYLRYRW